MHAFRDAIDKVGGKIKDVGADIVENVSRLNDAAQDLFSDGAEWLSTRLGRCSIRESQRPHASVMSLPG